MSKRDYAVERVATTEGLAKLEDEWNELIAELPDAHIFSTWEWLSTWWQHHAEDGELWLLTTRDATNGELAGIAPLMLARRRFGLLRVRVLTFIFYRPPIHQTIIAIPAHRTGVESAIVDYLYAHSAAWDALTLDGFLADSGLTAELQRAGGRYYERHPPICHVTVLPEDWDTYQMTHLSANRRQQLRRARRKLEEDYPGEVVFERLTNPVQVQSALETLVELNRHRWHEEGIRSTFDETRFVNFHREMVITALERDWLRFYRLTVAGTTAALRYCFRYRDLLYDYQLTFNLDLGKYRPGEILLAYVLREAMQEGVREFDMLRGTYRYKRSWATETRYEKHLLVSTGLRGHAWVLGAQLVDQAQERGRDVLPAGVRGWLNRVLSTAKRHTIQTTG